LDAAESIIRLRRLRRLSQVQLARRLKTKQPAIARLESGKTNVELNTLVAAARALGAIVRVEIEPQELLGREPFRAAWWDRDVIVNPFGAEPARATIELHVNQNTLNMCVVNIPGDLDQVPNWMDEASVQQIDVPSSILEGLRTTNNTSTRLLSDDS
jgi:transcriptional regulator with XRE-family HTH domain